MLAMLEPGEIPAQPERLAAVGGNGRHSDRRDARRVDRARDRAIAPPGGSRSAQGVGKRKMRKLLQYQ